MEKDSLDDADSEKKEDCSNQRTISESITLLEEKTPNAEELVEKLKKKLYEMDLLFENERIKCFICMSSYQNPVVSTNCWHVCCEECWMRALGAKKVCPKCSMIVSPASLRKIYLS